MDIPNCHHFFSRGMNLDGPIFCLDGGHLSLLERGEGGHPSFQDRESATGAGGDTIRSIFGTTPLPKIALVFTSLSRAPHPNTI
jgi:hypothetical protein